MFRKRNNKQFIFLAFIFILFIFMILILLPFILVKQQFWGQPSSQFFINVYQHQQDKIVKMELNEYLRGVVAAEMPAAYNMEALKAQAVAARTYTLRQLSIFGGRGNQQQPKADICTDYRYSQAWLSDQKMRERWGFLSFFYYWAKINRAIEETKDQVLVYNGQLIDAVYHANSGGQTEDSRFVWGGKSPYLKSVVSAFEQDSKNYLQVIEFTLPEIINKINKVNPRQVITGGKSQDLEIEILEYSDSGRVLELSINNQIFRGTELRSILNLPSTKFKLEKQGSKFIFTVIGYGHGVGMSQDGANGYAKQGYNYKSILKHYYQGVEIIDYKKLL